LGRFYTLGCMITVTLVCTVSRTLVSTSVRSCVGSSSDCLVSFRVCTWYVFFSPSCQPLRQRCVPRPSLRSSAPPQVESFDRWTERTGVVMTPVHNQLQSRHATSSTVPAWWERMVIAPLSQPSCGHLALPTSVTSCDRRHERCRVTSCHPCTIRLCVVMTPVIAPLSMTSCGVTSCHSCTLRPCVVMTPDRWTVRRVTSCYPYTIRPSVVMTPVTLAWSGRTVPAPLSLSSCGASFPRGCQV
jgi:hypothetical protein